MIRGLTRKTFLKASAGTLTVAYLASGCDFLSTDPAGRSGRKTQGAGKRGKEAPMLAKKVAAGELPPVEERLPKNPAVLEPLERTGVYGGEWSSGLVGVAESNWILRTMGFEHLVKWDLQWDRVLPNVAESFESNGEGTEYTFRLREGMRWSDGEPFTADDLMFWYEDVLLNKDLTPVIASWLVSGGKPVVVEKLDDYTVAFQFERPNGLFLQRLATPDGVYLTGYPRHYLEQFHQGYNKDIDTLVREADLDNWALLFNAKGGPWNLENPEQPTLNGWVITNALSDGNRLSAKRNPYYWKVDPEGSQLPYIDSQLYNLVQDQEVLLLKALNGDIDMQDSSLATLKNKPTLADNREKGNYHFYDTVSSFTNSMVIALNLCHKDKVKREIFNNRDFRVGLSHAINRQEIIDVALVSQGRPFQAAPRPGSPYYHERLATQYTEFDVNSANQSLDRAGFSERDSSGIRLGPDGEPIIFTVDTAPSGDVPAPFTDILELVRGYWEAVGIKINIKNIDRSLFYERKAANDHDATVWSGDGGGPDAILEPRWYFPYSTESNYAIPWGEWYSTEGQAGEAPPAPARRQMEVYDRIKGATEPAERKELMRRLLDMAADEFWVMGISLTPQGYGIVKNNFYNVPEKMPRSWLYPNPAPANTSQFFMEG